MEYENVSLSRSLHNYFLSTKKNRQEMYMLYYRKNYWIYYLFQVNRKRVFGNSDTNVNYNTNINVNDEKCNDHDNDITDDDNDKHCDINSIQVCSHIKENNGDISQCPIIKHLLNGNGKDKLKDSDSQRPNNCQILQHLSEYDHCKSFDISKPQCECNYNDTDKECPECRSLFNVSNRKRDTGVHWIKSIFIG